MSSSIDRALHVFHALTNNPNNIHATHTPRSTYICPGLPKGQSINTVLYTTGRDGSKDELTTKRYLDKEEYTVYR